MRKDNRKIVVVISIAKAINTMFKAMIIKTNTTTNNQEPKKRAIGARLFINTSFFLTGMDF